MKKKLKFNRYFVFLLIYAAVCILIWSNSVVCADNSQSMSDGLVSRILNLFKTEYGDLSGFPKFFIDNIRKFAHFGEFTLLGIVSAMWNCKKLDKTDFSTFRSSFLYAFFIAFIDESIQMFVPGRSGEIRDVWIDVLGIASGLLVFALVNLVLKSKKVREDA